MLEITLNNKEYSIPNGWDEVRIRDYQVIVETNELEGYSEIEKLATIISKISGIKIDDIFSMDSKEFTKIVSEMKFLNDDMKLKTVSKESIKVGDEEYYFYNNYSDLTVGETINIDLMMSKFDNKLHLCIPDLLTIFLRKKDENGEWEKYDTKFKDRRDLFLDLKITDVNGVVSFFSNSEKIS